MTDKKHFLQFGFITLIGLYAAACFYSSFSLRAQSGVVPRALSLIVFVLAIIVFFINIKEIKKPSVDAETEPNIKEKGYRGKKGVFLWLILNIVLVYFLGMYFTFFVSATIYFVLFGGKTLKKALLISAVYDAFIYIIFSVIAKFSLYPGILFY